MHVSLRHARRMMSGAALGALFLAAIPGIGQAQTCSEGICEVCISPKHQTINTHGGSACNAPNRLITWAEGGVAGPTGALGIGGLEGLAGPTGTTGAQGAQGAAGTNGPIGLTGPAGVQGPTGTQGIPGAAGAIGSAGPVGATGPTGPLGLAGPAGAIGLIGPVGVTGPTGPQGAVGPAGTIGNAGGTGATGPLGPAGEMGQQGSQGVQGVQGLTGPTGATGPNGTNGTQSFLLVGGDLGFRVQLYNAFTLGNFILLGYDPFTTTLQSPIYYGPGNGADSFIESEAAPIDAGTVSSLYVQVSGAFTGASGSYNFTLCHNSDCSSPPVACTVNLPTLTQCNDLVDTQDFNQGDTIALQGTATPDAPLANVMWSVVVTQTTPVGGSTYDGVKAGVAKAAHAAHAATQRAAAGTTQVPTLVLPE